MTDEEDPSTARVVSENAEVRKEVRDGALRLTISNPAQRNALTPSMLTELTTAFAEADSDDGVRVVVLRSSDTIFSSGYALGSFPKADDLHDHDELTEAGDAIARCSKATIAVLNGDAIGAAFDLVMAADFRIALANARLGITPARFGIIYPWQGVDRLVKKLGDGLARQLLLTGELVRAEELTALRCVNEVLAGPPELLAAEQRWIDLLMRSAPLSVAGTKHILGVVHQGAPTVEQRQEILELRRTAISSADAVEAVQAFREKRLPRFTGR